MSSISTQTGAPLLTSGSLESEGEAKMLRVMVNLRSFIKQENCQCGSNSMVILGGETVMEKEILWVSGTFPMEDL